ncbi:Tripeptidyl-peptidase sed1 [Lachnellula hyalina]|uniref:tripeptidyl-peptidase II n=1 Tax=Lachnellula hyalina TaxID=1316788 RepID=A0A8H8R974_9HELO|nr:Tripeptidyl-peptidase sed1 [Lachnellula hyalina]TVY30670.1 Tripeptidyl-peptidase sed1 [Lachnellula hyalina]
MKLTVLAIVGGFVAQALAAPAPVPYTLHEKREVQKEKWTRNLDVKLNRDAVIPISIGLTQRNLENGYDMLMDVSHPESPNYGKHWSMQKIKETFAPSAETVGSVKSWLAESGIDNSRVKFSKSLGWAKFNATVEEVEYLLRTEYYAYTNAETGNDHLACEDYSVPTHLKEHIDFVTPTIHFDALVKPKKNRRDLEKRSMRVRPTPQIKKGSDIAPGTDLSPDATKYTLANCYEYITPECLRALYNFTNGTLALSSYGIVEYTPQAYLQTDLNLFYTNLAREIPSGTKPTVDLIDGATVQTTTQSFDDNGESDLDLQYAIALVYPQKVTLYQTGDSVEGASFNNFLDAIDAAYCTSGGGDDSSQDGIYPDTASGGYKGDEDCGTFKAASVISTSYGYNEADLTAAYETRQCNEYMKLGLAGTTFLYSSGDYGVAGNSGQCCTKAKCAGGTYNSGTSGTFNPAFPATCPYVTSVGATQIKPNTLVTATAPEEACQTVIYSGGGFSNVFAMPSYQSAAVASYYTSHKPSFTATQYNNSQAVRGYPDVSANGANYVVAVDGTLSLVYGTSASAPTFGSVITLINEQRIAANKSVVGFINPTVYANPSAFNDITSGGNEGCGTAGFTAVAGWDPVTGLGTPNYPKLLAAFLALS